MRFENNSGENGAECAVPQNKAINTSKEAFLLSSVSLLHLLFAKMSHIARNSIAIRG